MKALASALLLLSLTAGAIAAIHSGELLNQAQAVLDEHLP